MNVKLWLVGSMAAVVAAVALGNNREHGATRFEDVEALMDKVEMYDNKTVTVPGEVDHLIDPKSFVLESGGLLNDEIVVVMSKSLSDAQKQMAVDDANVIVTGKIRRVSAADLRKELGWEFDAKLDKQFGRAKQFLIADEIQRKAE
jgi:hypothetical protein